MPVCVHRMSQSDSVCGGQNEGRLRGMGRRREGGRERQRDRHGERKKHPKEGRTSLLKAM